MSGTRMTRQRLAGAARAQVAEQDHIAATMLPWAPSSGRFPSYRSPTGGSSLFAAFTLVRTRWSHSNAPGVADQSAPADFQ